jgi:DNA-binding NarL/FixJ family response regulator
MLHVVIVASLPAVRERLRRLVEWGDVWPDGDVPATTLDVRAASSIEDAVVAGADDRGGGPTVLVLGDEHALIDMAASADEAGAAVVVVSDEPVRAASALAPLDLRGWVVVHAGVDGSQLRAALAAADAGLALVPAGALSALPAAKAPSRRGGLERLDDNDEDAPAESLTPREREVLELLGRGLANRAIASALGISDHTAKFHVASVLAKLGAANRADAVRRGIRQGLVTI